MTKLYKGRFTKNREGNQEFCFWIYVKSELCMEFSDGTVEEVCGMWEHKAQKSSLDSRYGFRILSLQPQERIKLSRE